MNGCPPNTIRYTVKAGDTFYMLARHYGTTVADIEALNPGVDPKNLQIGSMICVPLQPMYPVCTNGDYYVVQRGDTMYAIAQRYGVSLNALIKANPQIMNPSVIAIGAVLCIPRAPTTVNCPANSYHYRVVSGDTFYGIAHRYGVDLNALMKLNSGISPEKLEAGTIICIPLG